MITTCEKFNGVYVNITVQLWSSLAVIFKQYIQRKRKQGAQKNRAVPVPKRSDEKHRDVYATPIDISPSSVMFCKTAL
jgi:hypothetical protein